MKLKLSVKEIADIVGIPPRRIRYYDQIGLFTSSGVDPDNGYHYYALEKIEELRLITYLRHLNIPITEIKQHLENRNLEDYAKILERQLQQTHDKIKALNALATRLEKRMHSLDYIRHLPPLEEVLITTYPERDILVIKRAISGPIDWEVAMLEFEKRANLPPSLFIGDIGFFVNLNQLDTRHPTEFQGLYLFADDAYFRDDTMRQTLPAGNWLSLAFRGDHDDAPPFYKMLMSYAKKHHLRLGDYAMERVLVDHYISSDPAHYTTEIQIPILP